MFHLFRANSGWRAFRNLGLPSASRFGRQIPVRKLILPCITLAAASSWDYRVLRNETLLPDSKGDTFEMGLYLSSQKELDQHIAAKRQRVLGQCRTRISRWFSRGWYKFKDIILEPILTTLRFLELSVIFVPVLLLYPISYFGHSVRVADSTTSTKTPYGALVWYRLLRRALEIAGPSFIKLGQWAGSRTDMFSEGLCIELGNLHSHAKKHSLKYTVQQVCEALDIKDLSEASFRAV